MKIIRPNRLRCMLRDARCAIRNAPVRLASMTVSNFSTVIRMRNASAAMPAFDTRTSTGPWCSSTAVNARSTASVSVTSHTTPNSGSGTPDPRWVTATLCPSAASRCAIASPIPRLPPVTSTDRETNAGFPVSVMPVNLVPYPSGPASRLARVIQRNQPGRRRLSSTAAKAESASNSEPSRSQPTLASPLTVS